MGKEQKWGNVTEQFPEEQRYYKNVYLEICEVFDEEVKSELEAEYQKHEEPTGEFIRDFAERHKVCLPNDIVFDTDAFFEAFGGLNYF